MSRVPVITLFVFAWLAVFAQTQFRPVTGFLGTPLTVLPALMVYATLTHRLAVVTGLAIFGSIGLDALSAGPLGVSVLPLFLSGFVLHLRRHLILRDQAYAQFWLGLAAGITMPLLTMLLMHLGAARPLAGPYQLWQIAVTGLLNGALCPAIFRLFDALRQAFDYPPVSEGSFRPDREIKRGRL